MRKNIYIFLGPQGSGKSTQAELISNKKKYTHLIESDLLNNFVKKNNSESKMVKDMMKKGDMIPFEISCDVLFKKIDSLKSKNIIIDGFPRTIDQAYVFDYFVYKNKYNLKGLIYIKLDKKECVKRLLLRNRDDDKKDIIDNRLKIYFKKTKKVLLHYKEKNKLIEINGNQTIENVNKEILTKTKKIM
jgi:adenylate kinase